MGFFSLLCLSIAWRIRRRKGKRGSREKSSHMRCNDVRSYTSQADEHDMKGVGGEDGSDECVQLGFRMSSWEKRATLKKRLSRFIIFIRTPRARGEGKFFAFVCYILWPFLEMTSNKEVKRVLREQLLISCTLLVAATSCPHVGPKVWLAGERWSFLARSFASDEDESALRQSEKKEERSKIGISSSFWPEQGKWAALSVVCLSRFEEISEMSRSIWPTWLTCQSSSSLPPVKAGLLVTVFPERTNYKRNDFWVSICSILELNTVIAIPAPTDSIKNSRRRKKRPFRRCKLGTDGEKKIRVNEILIEKGNIKEAAKKEEPFFDSFLGLACGGDCCQLSVWGPKPTPKKKRRKKKSLLQ